MFLFVFVLFYYSKGAWYSNWRRTAIFWTIDIGNDASKQPTGKQHWHRQALQKAISVSRTIWRAVEACHCSCGETGSSRRSWRIYVVCCNSNANFLAAPEHSIPARCNCSCLEISRRKCSADNNWKHEHRRTTDRIPLLGHRRTRRLRRFVVQCCS